MQLDVLIALTQASYRNMKSYCTSKVSLLNIINKRVGILKTHLEF